MSHPSKNTTIPPGTMLGLRQISRQLGNIKFSREVNEFLSEIDGKIVMSYSPESDSISHKIVSADTGKTLVQTAEFERLGKYRSMVNEAKDKEEEDLRKDSKIAVYHNLMVRYKNDEGKKPASRMLVANQSRFGNMKKSLAIIEDNMKVVKTLTTSESKKYILKTGSILLKVYMKGLVACFGNEKYEQSTHDEIVFKVGIPKWMETKLTDKNFVKDAKHDALPLIFPKGNFAKSLSFRTDELKADHFMVANKVVMAYSHSLIALARGDKLRDWFIPDNHRMKDDIREQWKKFTWPMLSAGTVDDFLDPRVKGMNVRTFSPQLAPREKPGQENFRPEGAMQKEIRTIKNQHMKMMSVMLDFFHFIPRVSDPLGDFWTKVAETDGWIITPDKTIYGWLLEATNKVNMLNQMKRSSTQAMRKKIADVVLVNLDVPVESNRHAKMLEMIEDAGSNIVNANHLDDDDRLEYIGKLPDIKIANLESVASLNESARTEVYEFCGRTTEEAIKTKKRDRIGSKGLLSKAAKRTINKIDDEELVKAATKWLREDFSKDELREVAARYFVSAASDLSLGNLRDSDSESSDDEDSV